MSTEVTDPYSSLRKALEKATPGPWKLYAGSRSIVAERSHLRADISVATASWGNRYCPEKFSAEANGAYIAAANPSEISALLSERDELVKAVEDAAARFRHIRDKLQNPMETMQRLSFANDIWHYECEARKPLGPGPGETNV